MDRPKFTNELKVNSSNLNTVATEIWRVGVYYLYAGTRQIIKTAYKTWTFDVAYMIQHTYHKHKVAPNAILLK